jgi:hypothetical protein
MAGQIEAKMQRQLVEIVGVCGQCIQPGRSENVELDRLA